MSTNRLEIPSVIRRLRSQNKKKFQILGHSFAKTAVAMLDD